MKRIFIMLCAICGLSVMAGAQVRIEGKIKKYAGEPVVVTYSKGKLDMSETVRVAKNGKFVYENAEYVATFITIADNRLALVLEPGSCVEMQVDLKDAQNIEVRFEGDYTAENNYQFAMAQLQSTEQALLSGGYVAFKDYRDALQPRLAAVSEKVALLPEGKMKTQSMELQSVLFDYLAWDYYRTLQRSDAEKLSADTDFAAFMKSIDLNDDKTADYNVRAFVINWYLDKEELRDERAKEKRYLQLAAELISDPAVRNVHLSEYMEWRLKSDKVKYMPEVFEVYQSLCTDAEAVNANRDRLNTYMNHFKIRNGVMAPDFEMVDVNGNRVRLSDFRGKMVYIDVWATWCAPCCAEIPYVGKLREHFVNDPRIEFISISVDTQVKKWQKMVEEEQLPWKQFIVEGGTRSPFYKGYAIEFIPRFMLIGKDGKIVEINYMNPSTPGCAENLTAILDNQ